MQLTRTSWGAARLSASVLNAFDRRYAFNFGNPFSGTHFGAPRQFRLDLQLRFD
jgi:outer membrane receptor protein involved in Fe transport